MILKTITKNLSILFLSFILAFKLSISLSPHFEPVEIGELQTDSKYSQICGFKEVDLLYLDNKDLDTIAASKNTFCSNYWGTKKMRGFYLHHYSAFFDGNYKKNDILTNLVNSLNHQYGAITQIFPYLLMTSGINLNVQIFSAISLLVGSILNFLVIFAAKKKKVIDKKEFSIITIVLSLSLLLININQFFVSPGFTPIRMLPITLISMLLISIERNKIEFRRIIIYFLTFLTFLILSPQFEILIFIALIGSYIFSKIIFTNNELREIEVINSKMNKILKLIIIIAISIFLKFFGLFLIGEINELFTSSSSDTTLYKRIFISFTFIFSGLWFLNGLNNNTTNLNNLIENKLNISSPLLFLTLVLFLYPSKFWGSPNHFALYLFANASTFGLLISNVLRFNSSFKYEFNFLDYDLINKNLEKIYFKVFQKEKKFFLSTIQTSKILNYLIIIFSYLLLFISTQFIKGIIIPMNKNELNGARGIKQNLDFDRNVVDLQNDCKAKDLPISSFSIKSCGISDFEYQKHKVKISKYIDSKNKLYYLSDNDVILDDKVFNNLKDGGSLTPIKGKVEILKNTKIRNAFTKSFLRMFKIFQSKDFLLSDIILELDSEDYLLSDISNKLKVEDIFISNLKFNKLDKKDTVLFKENIDILINDLFDISYLSSSKKDLSQKTIMVDHNLSEQIKSLYIYAYEVWNKKDKNFRDQDLQEICSKLYKYLWRIYLFNNRSGPEYKIFENKNLLESKMF